MKKTTLLFIVILFVTVSCQPAPPTPVPPPAILPTATLVLPKVTPTAAEEIYERVDPAELDCVLDGLSVRAIVGKPEGTEGEVQTLICEGKTIELVSTKLSGGFLETKEYGKIKIQMSNSISSGGFSLWLTPKQKDAIIKAVKTEATLSEEEYEAVAVADYEPNMEFSGRIQWDENGLVNGGPVVSFSFWGQKIELTSDMITNGLLSTKDYGKIMLKANPDGSLHMELTPSQQEKIKQLKAKPPTAALVLPTTTPLPPTLSPTPVLPTGTPDPTKGKIEGRVYRSDTNQAIVNTGVTLRDTEYKELLKTMTDMQGRYQIPSLQPGKYSLSVELSFTDPVFSSCGNLSVTGGDWLFVTEVRGGKQVLLGADRLSFDVPAGEILTTDLALTCK